MTSLNHNPESRIHEVPTDLSPLLLYRDGLILVLNKPAGIAVHPGPSGGPSLEDSFDSLRFGLPRIPSLAHRLDRDTTGCLVLGRHRKALQKLGKIFAQGNAKKTYWALVEGTPDPQEGIIDQPLKKISSAQKGWKIIIAPDGQASSTSYKTLASNGVLSLLELTPHTGRTHQIRVHCAHLGTPILGDMWYGTADKNDKPTLFLHARSITLPLYPTKKLPIHITAPLPKLFEEECVKLGVDTNKTE